MPRLVGASRRAELPFWHSVCWEHLIALLLEKVLEKGVNLGLPMRTATSCTGDALLALMSLGFPFPPLPQFLCNPFHTTVVFPVENLRWQQHHSFYNQSRSSCDLSLCHQSLDLINEGPLYLTALLANRPPIEEWKCSFLADLVMCRSHLEVLHPCCIHLCK